MSWSTSKSSREADAIELRAMVEEHQRRGPSSPVAARVLGEWEELLPGARS